MTSIRFIYENFLSNQHFLGDLDKKEFISRNLALYETFILGHIWQLKLHCVTCDLKLLLLSPLIQFISIYSILASPLSFLKIWPRDYCLKAADQEPGLSRHLLLNSKYWEVTYMTRTYWNDAKHSQLTFVPQYSDRSSQKSALIHLECSNTAI